MASIDIARLKAEATEVAGEFTCSKDCSAGSVGAALLSDAGHIFTGICIDTACSLGFCAEHAAIAAMLKERQTAIRAIVAVKSDGRVLPPCGRCRELIRQVDPKNWETLVVLSDTQFVTLRELLPYRE
jgi:cytidine deaminase